MQPSVESVGVAKPRHVPPGGYQGVLDRVSRELAIPEDESCRSVQPRDSRANEHREGVMIALLRKFDETPLVHRRLSSCAPGWRARMVCRTATANRSPLVEAPASAHEVDDPQLAEPDHDELDRDGRKQDPEHLLEHDDPLR